MNNNQLSHYGKHYTRLQGDINMIQTDELLLSYIITCNGGDNDGLLAFWRSDACGERRTFWRSLNIVYGMNYHSHLYRYRYLIYYLLIYHKYYCYLYNQLVYHLCWWGGVSSTSIHTLNSPFI